MNFCRPYFLLPLLLTQLSCQTIGNLIDHWFYKELVPESFVMPFRPNVTEKKTSSYFTNFPTQKSRTIRIPSIGVEFHAARFKNIEIAIATFLETKTIDSQPIPVKNNYWAYFKKNGSLASMWQDRSVYMIKSLVSKDKQFFITLFEKITHELPPENKRPLYFRVFLHPKTNILKLRYGWKNQTSNDTPNNHVSILTGYFHAPWKLNKGEATLAIRSFPEPALAKQFFYDLVKTGSLRFLTQWNTQISGSKSLVIDSEQKIEAFIEKNISYSVIIANRGLHHDYFILYENNIILLSGEITKEKDARGALSDIFRYLD